MEEKYEKLYEPLYDRRRHIILGDMEPDFEADHIKRDLRAEDIRIQQEILDSRDAQQIRGFIDNVENNSGDIVGIPDFWLTGEIMKHES